MRVAIVVDAISLIVTHPSKADNGAVSAPDSELGAHFVVRDSTAPPIEVAGQCIDKRRLLDGHAPNKVEQLNKLRFACGVMDVIICHRIYSKTQQRRGTFLGVACIHTA